MWIPVISLAALLGHTYGQIQQPFPPNVFPRNYFPPNGFPQSGLSIANDRNEERKIEKCGFL